MTKKKVAIIGAGIAGIATAIRLSHKGYAIEVFESNNTPGGKIQEFYLNNCRFDAGPSLLTLPSLVEELFQLADMKMNDHVPYQRLNVITKYFFEDGTEIVGYADPERFAEEVASVTNVPKETVINFLKESKRYYQITNQPFLFQSLHKLSNYIKKGTLSSLIKLPSLPLFSTMHQMNQQWFNDDKVVQLFDRYATYNGSDPYSAPALLNVIPHLEHNIGAFYPSHGMYSIIKGLVKVADRLNVKFHYDKKVERIHIKKGKVKGIRVNNIDEEFDLVVSNMDVIPTYRKLLKDINEPTVYTKQSRSSSALIFYWAMSDKFPELDLHNIFFSNNYKDEFQNIFDKFNVSDDPTVYLYISSKKVADDAPPGKENWFVMINVPSDNGQDWERITADARKNILKKVSRILEKDIENMIESERILDPLTIEENTSSFQGALYGNSSNNALSAFLRHPNFSSSVKGLYFCGGSVHPGGGIPLCLASAKIVSDLINI